MITLLLTLIALIAATSGTKILFMIGIGMLTFIGLHTLDRFQSWIQTSHARSMIATWQLPRIKIAFAVAIG
jgi:hypothetical protein